MSNETLANAARSALKGRGFEKQKGYCQRFVRQVLESVYGSKYARYMETSAKKTAYSFLESNHGFRYNGQKLEAGDILYKTVGSGGFGHVGIYLGDGQVAENSSFHAHHDSDARGVRTLAQYGEFQVVVRLPDPRGASVVVAPQVASKPVAVPQNQVIIVRNGIDQRVLTENNVQGILLAAGVQISKLGTWADGTPVIYVQ